MIESDKNLWASVAKMLSKYSFKVVLGVRTLSPDEQRKSWESLKSKLMRCGSFKETLPDLFAIKECSTSIIPTFALHSRRRNPEEHGIWFDVCKKRASSAK